MVPCFFCKIAPANIFAHVDHTGWERGHNAAITPPDRHFNDHDDIIKKSFKNAHLAFEYW